jgi:hypothetical protein
MKRSFHLPHLSTLVRERLTALDATQLPAAALTQIERDVLTACQRVVLRTVTGPRIGRAVAAALAAPAATQGRKGADAPLPSNLTAPEAREGVAGQTSNPASIPVSECASGMFEQPQGGQP